PARLSLHQTCNHLCKGFRWYFLSLSCEYSVRVQQPDFPLGETAAPPETTRAIDGELCTSLNKHCNSCCTGEEKENGDPKHSTAGFPSQSPLAPTPRNSCEKTRRDMKHLGPNLF
ncbi:unnamed protein product, partial [Ectocarpus sp. 8 AP-2014]